MYKHEENSNTKLLARRPTSIRFDGRSWLVATAVLYICPLPCLGIWVHLPGRHLRVRASRWAAAKAAAIIFLVSTFVAVFVGFYAGRYTAPPLAARSTTSGFSPLPAVSTTNTNAAKPATDLQVAPSSAVEESTNLIAPEPAASAEARTRDLEASWMKYSASRHAVDRLKPGTSADAGRVLHIPVVVPDNPYETYPR